MDSRSTTGYCTMVGGNLVVLGRKKKTTSMSSTKVEFQAMSSGIDEVLWIHEILKDLKCTHEEPI